MNFILEIPQNDDLICNEIQEHIQPFTGIPDIADIKLEQRLQVTVCPFTISSFPIHIIKRRITEIQISPVHTHLFITGVLIQEPEFLVNRGMNGPARFPEFVDPVINQLLGSFFMEYGSFQIVNERSRIQLVPDISMNRELVISGISKNPVDVRLHCFGCADKCRCIRVECQSFCHKIVTVFLSAFKAPSRCIKGERDNGDQDKSSCIV